LSVYPAPHTRAVLYCLYDATTLTGALIVTKKFKLKTHKATVKRFRVTGTGKLVRTKGGKSHLRRRTPKRTKRQFTKMQAVTNSMERRRVHRLAPYLRRHKANPPG